MRLRDRVLEVALTEANSKRVAAILNHDHKVVASIMAKLRAADLLPPLTRTKTPSRPYADEEDDYLLTARRNGRKWREIADAMKRSVSSVETRCKLLVLGLDPEDMPAGMAEAPTPKVAELKPWPASATFGGDRETDEGSVPYHIRITPARPPLYLSATGNAAAMCAGYGR